MNFKVTDPKGASFGGKHYPKGEAFTAPNKGDAVIVTLLHFKQIEPSTEKSKIETTEKPKDSTDKK